MAAETAQTYAEIPTFNYAGYDLLKVWVYSDEEALVEVWRDDAFQFCVTVRGSHFVADTMDAIDGVPSTHITYDSREDWNRL